MNDVNNDDMLEDEAYHARLSKPISLKELMNADLTCNVVLHNTMRFDVQLAYIQPILDDYIDKQEIVDAIRNAIVGAVKTVIGTSLECGGPLPHAPMVSLVSKSKMLHRETISFDLS